MRRTFLLLLACGLLAFPSASLADTILTAQSGNSLAGFSGGWTQGYDFTTAGPIKVTDLGVFDDNSDGLGGDYTIGLWLTSSQTLLGSVTVDNSSSLGGPGYLNGQYRYGTLSSPLVLGAGTYTLASFLPVTTNAPAFGSFTTGAGITHGVRRFQFGSFAFPTGTDGIGSGLVNAQFTAVPEPSTAGLIGLAVVGFGYFRRRK